MRGWREEILKCNGEEIYLEIDKKDIKEREDVAKAIKDNEGDKCDYNKSNGKLLKDEIKRLYEELAEIPHNERTTMTREKIVDMIFKLERLDLDKYSYINNYEDKVVMGVGDNNCESRSCINSDGVQVEVCKLHTYKN